MSSSTPAGTTTSSENRTAVEQPCEYALSDGMQPEESLRDYAARLAEGTRRVYDLIGLSHPFASAIDPRQEAAVLDGMD